MPASSFQRGKKMKKKFILIFILIFLAVSGSQALAKERIVKLTLPGCSA